MSQQNILKMAAAAALACAAISRPGVAIAASPPAAPPDGTYAYAINQSGRQIGQTSIEVKRDATSIALHETEKFTNIDGQFIADEAIEPVGLTLTSYMASFPTRGPVITARLRFDGGGASESVDGSSGVTDFRLVKGTKHQVVIDQAWMTGFLMLPAQVKAQSLTDFTLLTPSNPSPGQYRGHVLPAANPSRPAAVPASDVSLSVTGPANFVEWYDPQSMAVDEVDVASQQVTILRTHATH